MSWQRIWTIARWEYIQKARSKGFIVSLVLTPVLIVVMGVAPSLLINKSADSTELIGLIDSTGMLYMPLTAQLRNVDTLSNGEPSYVLANYLSPGLSIDSALRKADRDILAEKVDGVLVVRDSAGHMNATFRSLNPSNFRPLLIFNDAINRIVTRHRLVESGIDTAVYSRLSQEIEVNPLKVTEGGGSESGGFLQTFFSAYIGCILFMILILTTGQTLVRSLVEEKSNRIMELLVSSGTAQELMWGKLIGLGGLGVTQIAAWLLLGFLAIGYFHVPITSDAIAPLPFILVYIVLGYFFYSAIFIGFGSLVTTEQEAQIVTQYITMFLAAPLAFSILVIQSPDASYVQGLSYVPLLTPTLMMLRVVTKMPPAWEIIGTIGLMLVSTAVVMWIASRIFRTAILMYGKRPSMAEIGRWLRKAG
jgi:ABC-2 type transport system permease protein